MKATDLFRSDGWVNLFTSLGGKKDRSSNTSIAGGVQFQQQELESLYLYTGLARKIIDMPANEMTREWIDIENDPENKAMKELKRIEAKSALRDCIRWGDLYGGAIIVMGIDDGGMLEQPLNESGIRSIDFLKVYDRWQVSWSSSDVNNDPSSRFFGEPELYTIQAYTTSTMFKVHRSRVLRYDGAEIPEKARVQNQGWGHSKLQSVYTELKNHGIVSESTVSICQDFVQTILNIENLADLIANGKEDIVRKRLEILDLSRSVNNTILLDGEEKFSKQSSTVTGIDKLMQEFAVLLSAVTGIPITKLFGRSPAGLNASGDSDIRMFYDEIKNRQDDFLLPMLERLVYIIMKSRDGGYNRIVNEDAIVSFTPLWQMTDQEEADYKYKVAQTDEIYINTGVLNSDEVAVSRFEGGYSADTEVDLTQSRRNEPDNDAPEE